jgi:hypothetical protein
VRGLALALAVLLWPAPAEAQVDVLPPDLVAQLVPGKERPLALAPSGDPERFLADAPGTWEEAAPPIMLDVGRTGTRDHVVFLLVDARTDHRALVIHEWGQSPDAFGRAVFYAILESDGEVLEWAGTYRLSPGPPAAATPSARPAP